nr:unnamed protein product [Digitaria exilis]
MAATCNTIARLAPQSQRKLRHYKPSPWGDFFLNHVTYTPPQLLSMKERAHIKEDEVRGIILEIIASSNLTQKLELVDTLQRIGVDYHYKKEINDLLCSIYNDKDGGSNDLYITSLRFYLLRKHGYTVPADVFEKFRDEQGTISSDDMVEGCPITRRPELRTRQNVSLLDDLYDNYSTTEESNIFTTAIERWDEQTTDKFPEDMKALFINILNTTNKIEEELKLQGNRHAELVKKLVICTAKFYHAELKWRDEHYVPTSVDEHLQISMRSSVCMQIINLVLISLRDVSPTREDDVDWIFTFPKMIRGVSIVGRIGNDIVSHEREQASIHVVSTVQTCMKQYGVTAEQAKQKLSVTIEEAWMDIVEDYLDQKHPMELLEKSVDVARTMDFFYKYDDAYTLPLSLKDTLTSMYVDSV